MDSLITWRLFAPHALPVFVRTGSRYELLDMPFAQSQALGALVVLHLPKLNEYANGVVPHRNAILLAAVSNILLANQVYVSAPRGELIWDQQRAFHKAMERVLRGVRVLNPLRRYTKTQAVRKWLDAGLPADTLLKSRSCYGTFPTHCGRCAACFKRYIALRNNGLEELTLSDVPRAARKLGKIVQPLDVLRYGLRPSYEAWRALR